MKNFAAPLLAVLLAAGFAPARSFTNTEGKTIEAEIAAATNTSVTLKLRSGRKATVPLDTLSEADREYVRDWIRNRVPRLRVTPKLVRSNRDDDTGGFFFFDEDRQTQVLAMTVEIMNEDTRVGLGETELKYILVGRSVANSKQYKILAVQTATFTLGRQDETTIEFKKVKNSYEDGDFGKSGHKCIGYVLHATRKSDGREVHASASTSVLEDGLVNIVGLKSGDVTNEHFLKPGKKGDQDGDGIIVVE